MLSLALCFLSRPCQGFSHWWSGGHLFFHRGVLHTMADAERGWTLYLHWSSCSSIICCLFLWILRNSDRFAWICAYTGWVCRRDYAMACMGIGSDWDHISVYLPREIQVVCSALYLLRLSLAIVYWVSLNSYYDYLGLRLETVLYLVVALSPAVILALFMSPPDGLKELACGGLIYITGKLVGVACLLCSGILARIHPYCYFCPRRTVFIGDYVIAVIV